jgi:hypothetical protein
MLPGPVAAALALGLTALACEPPGSGGPAPGASTTPTAAPTSLDTIPSLVILDTLPDAEPLLIRPTGATVLSNGNLVVLDQWGASVRFFDPSGELIRSVGREGQGPGEFRAPTWLGHCGPDEVFVWDGMQGRITVIDSAGSVVRVYSPAKDPSFLRCSRAGRFAVFGTEVDPPQSVSMGDAFTQQPAAPLRFESTNGDSIGGVGIVPMGETWILGRITQFAISEDRLYVGTADSARVDAYDLDGTRLRSLPLAITPRAPTEANVEQWLEVQWQAIQSDTEYRRWGKEMTRKNSKVPENLPLYTALAVDPEGLLWVVLSSPGDGETRFQVVDPNGPILGEFRIPRDLELFEVGSDYVLGRIYDTNDVPGIALYRFRRGSP